MLWNMIVEAQTEEQLTASITVEAPNWYSALREGLEKHHVDGAVLSTLSCRVQADRTVIASDAVSNRVFVLRPVEAASAVEATGETEGGEGAAAVADAPPLDHELFLIRDRRPADDDGVCYRERHIAVKGEISKQDASHLVHHYFDLLKAEGAPDGCRCFISVHLYDHVFTERSERPPIVALTWREWMSEKPKLLYPLSGDEGTTFSLLPAPQEPILLVPKEAARDGSRDKEKAETGRDAERFGVGERMVAAFEGMQDIYGIHKHEEAAAFVLSLARDLVRAEGGSCMLLSPKEYVLYVAAAQGAVATPYLKKTVSSRSGIIGFALKNSAVINVSDPAGDGRFDESDDGREGFSPRSVLCAPMQYEGQVIGVLELVNSPRADGFIDEEVNVLSYLGTSFAEYAALSLPSRQAEFTDREFADIPGASPQSRPSETRAKKASASATAEKPVAGTGKAPSSKAPEKKKAEPVAPAKAEEKKPAARAAGKSAGKKRSGKKKKRR